MTKGGYSSSQELGDPGSAEPGAEALGTVGLTGRTRSATPSHPSDPDPTVSDASTEHYRLLYFDPPPEFSRHILTLFYLEWDAPVIADRHPGALGQLFITMRGHGEIQFEDRSDHVGDSGDGSGGSNVYMFSGFETAALFKMNGPWHTVGISLSPLGWASLSQASASTYLNRIFPASELMGEEIEGFARDVSEQYRAGAMNGIEAAKALMRWAAPKLRSIPAAHENLINKTVAWLGTSLNPDVETLFAELGYSRRQAERLVNRYFGFSPAALARKYRAIRAANLLAQEGLTDEGEAEIAAAFYDQPHMIREIRRYSGHTPARLGGPEEPLFLNMLRLKNLDRLKQFRTIGAPDSV